MFVFVDNSALDKISDVDCFWTATLISRCRNILLCRIVVILWCYALQDLSSQIQIIFRVVSVWTVRLLIIPECRLLISVTEIRQDIFEWSVVLFSSILLIFFVNILSSYRLWVLGIRLIFNQWFLSLFKCILVLFLGLYWLLIIFEWILYNYSTLFHFSFSLWNNRTIFG